MKTVLILIALGLGISIVPVHAQNLDEWFRQKRTQRRYLATQIAALQIYGNALQDGYRVFQAGSGLIRDIKSGEFGLHNQHLQTLMGLSPRLQPISNAIAFGNHFMGLSNEIRKSRQRLNGMEMKADERLMLGKVYAGMLQKAIYAASQMEMLLRNGELQLTEAERLQLASQIDAELGTIKEDLIALNSMLEFYTAYGTSIQKDNQVIQNILQP